MPYALPSPRTLRTPAARKPHDMITSSTPWPRSQSSMNAMKGRSTSGTTGFGTVEVSGRSRVPSPPARISACTSGARPGAGHRGSHALRAAADALEGEARPAQRLGVEHVAPVDHEPTAHPPRRRVPVELLELRPLGHEHDRVRVV